MDRIKSWLVIALVVLVSVTAVDLIPKALNGELGVQPSPQAIQNTNRAAFIAACKKDVPPSAGFTQVEIQQYCACAESVIRGIHPDIYTNTAISNRVIETGYYQSEIDRVVNQCT